MARHLVILARAPQPGRVKRRLAREIGDLIASRFYRAALVEQIRHLAKDPRWRLWLFIEPPGARHHPAWGAVPPARVKRQGTGDLGHRMKRPFRLLPPGPLVLVGSDIPLMRREHVWRAFELLGRHDLVFGPAGDGGFWLLGARRIRPLPTDLFKGVRWSTRHALADSLATVPPSLSLALADRLDDVDDAVGYRRYREAARAGRQNRRPPLASGGSVRCSF